MQDVTLLCTAHVDSEHIHKSQKHNDFLKLCSHFMTMILFHIYTAKRLCSYIQKPIELVMPA